MATSNQFSFRYVSCENGITEIHVSKAIDHFYESCFWSVKCNPSFHRSVDIRNLNSEGKTVLHMDEYAGLKEEIKLDLSHLEAGFYVIDLRAGAESAVATFMVN